MADVTRGSASVTQRRRLSNAFKQTRLSCKGGRKHWQEEYEKETINGELSHVEIEKEMRRWMKGRGGWEKEMR